MSAIETNFLTIAHGAGNDPVLLERAVDADMDYVEADLWHHAGHRAVARHERRLAPLPLLFDKWYLKLAFRPFSLDDIIQTIRGHRVRLYADLKSGKHGFVWDVLKTLHRHNALEGAILSGHHWSELLEARRKAPVHIFPSVQDDAALMRFLRFLDRADGLVDGVAIRHSLLTKETVATFHERGLRVLPWTVDWSDRAHELHEYGVDGMISNSLTLLRNLRPAIAGES